MSEPKLCPYRHPENTPFGEYNTRDKYPPDFYTFAPCLEDKCAMWRTFEVNKAFSTDGVENIEYVRYTQGWCGLAGKP